MRTRRRNQNRPTGVAPDRCCCSSKLLTTRNPPSTWNIVTARLWLKKSPRRAGPALSITVAGGTMTQLWPSTTSTHARPRNPSKAGTLERPVDVRSVSIDRCRVCSWSASKNDALSRESCAATPSCHSVATHSTESPPLMGWRSTADELHCWSRPRVGSPAATGVTIWASFVVHVDVTRERSNGFERRRAAT